MQQRKEAEKLLNRGSIFGCGGLHCNDILIVLGGRREKHRDLLNYRTDLFKTDFRKLMIWH